MKSEENSPYADDEIKIYGEEGDEKDEIKKSENLNEDKKQLVGDSDDETDGSARPKDESLENPFLSGPGVSLQFQQFCSSLFYPGLQSQLARLPFMYGKDNFPIPPPMPMGYPLPPSAHPGLFPLYPPDMSKWAAFPRFPMLPNGLPGSPLLPGSPVPPFMSIPGLTSPSLNPLNKIPPHMMDSYEESFRGHMLNHHNGLNNTDHHYFPDTSYAQQKAPPKKPTIKKPLNAFMIFMKENRPAVIAKYKTKESASINQILGREWHALGREAQQEYYDMAKKEKESHALKYPGWSARDNYAMNSKKKKNKIGHSESASSGSDSPRCNMVKHPPQSCNSLELLISTPT